MCFYNINGVLIEVHPSGTYLIKISIVNDTEGIEFTQYGMDDYLSSPSRASFYSRRWLRGYHVLV